MTGLLPPNASALERAVEALIAARADAIAVSLRDLWSAEDCPEELLPWLAWSLSIDHWDPAWPVGIRRARVAAAIEIQRRKGTAKSVRDVVAAYGGAIALREWFETTPPGAPHTFNMIVYGGQADLIDAVISDVTGTKPLRSHFTFTQALTADGAVSVVGGFRPAVYLRCNGLSNTLTILPDGMLFDPLFSFEPVTEPLAGDALVVDAS